MPGIAVVTNPRSRQNRRNPQIAGQLSYMLGERGEMAQPQTLPELVEAARRFRDRGIDVLAINGGDGTAHVVLTAFARAYGADPLPTVALLRGGTMNTVASGLGIRGTPATLLGALIERYHRGEPLPTAERHLLKVDGQEPQYGFLFGNGLLSNFLEAYYRGAEPSPTKAALLLARGIGSALVGGTFFKELIRPVEVEVEVDGQRFEVRPYLAVAAGTVDDLGLRFRPFSAIHRHPGYMHALGFHCGPVDLVYQVMRFRFALLPSSPNIWSQVTRRMVIRGRGPLAYMVDGDFHQGGDTLEVSMGPSVRFVLG